MFKFKISKAEWETLSDEQKALYTAKGENYQLSVDGMPDFDGMQSKLNTLLDETKQAKKDKADAEAKAKAEADDAARKNGNVEAIEKSWGDKYAQAEQEHKATVAKYHDQVSRLMVTNEAQGLATKLFGKNAALLQHHIVGRLALEQGENGEFKTRILDKEGKPTANTIADLEKEFTGREDLKSFLVATKATGPTGATHSATTTESSRQSGAETMEQRRERARAIAASDSE